MVGLAGLEPAASSLSGIEGSALCGPAFPQVAGDRRGRRDAFYQPAPVSAQTQRPGRRQGCHQPDKAMRLPVLTPFLVGVAVLHRTLPAVLGYDPTTGQALPSSPTDLQRGRLVQRHPHSERLSGLVLDQRVPKSQVDTVRLGWPVVEVIYDRAGWDATNAGVANLWTGRLHRHLRRWCRAVLGACGSATPEGVPCRVQAG
jgi:hypothetical protein